MIIDTRTVPIRRLTTDTGSTIVADGEIRDLDERLMTQCTACHEVRSRDSAEWTWLEDTDINDDGWDLVPPVDSITVPIKPAPPARSAIESVPLDEDEGDKDAYYYQWQPARDLSPEEIEAFAAILLVDGGFLAARTHVELEQAAELVDPTMARATWRPIRRALELRRPSLVEEVAPLLAAEVRFRAAKGVARREIMREVLPEWRHYSDHRFGPAVIDRATELVDEELTPVVAELKAQGMTNVAIGVRLNISSNRVAKLLARAREGQGK